MLAIVGPGDVPDLSVRISSANLCRKPSACWHSLVPMMKLRLAKPGQLVDLQDLSELRGIHNEAPLDPVIQLAGPTGEAEAADFVMAMGPRAKYGCPSARPLFGQAGSPFPAREAGWPPSDAQADNCAWAFVRRHGLRIFKCAAGLEIGGDAGCSKHVATELPLEASLGRSPAYHLIGIDAMHRPVGQDSRSSGRRAEEGGLTVIADPGCPLTKPAGSLRATVLVTAVNRGPDLQDHHQPADRQTRGPDDAGAGIRG
jgi:hypothetical protein